MRNFQNYKIFLSGIDNDTEIIFEHQKEYLCCKEGCSLCCERGDYPMSQIEFNYMMQGFSKLSKELQNEIKLNIEEIIKNGDKDSYKCPFLKENRCTIYKYRPLVCRLFGVLTEDASGKPAYPFCMEEGLNYYNIYDKEKGHMSMDLVLEKGFKNYPHFFKLSNNIVMELPLAKQLNVDFGKTGRMIDFLCEENN